MLEANDEAVDGVAAQSRSRWPWRALALVVLAALCLRIGRALVASPLTKDSVLYVEMAEDWASGGRAGAFERNPRIPPLYLGLMALGARVGAGAEATGLLVSLLAGALLPLAVYGLARGVATERPVALLAAILAAGHPLLRGSAEIMRDSLYLICLVAALALAVAAVGCRGWRAWAGMALAGLLAALAAMTRDEGGEFLVILAAWGLWELWRGEACFPARLRRVVGLLAVAVTVYFLVVLTAWHVLAGSGSTWRPVPNRLMNYVHAFRAEFAPEGVGP